MDRSEHINDLAAALARAQGKFKTVKRSGHNPTFNSSYATFDDVIGAVKKPLSDEKLAYLQLVERGETGIQLTTMLLHESAQFISVTMDIKSVPTNRAVNEMQALGSALTYAKKYQLSALLGVNTETDDDGNASGQQTNGKQQDPPPQSEQAQVAQAEKERVEAERKAAKDKLTAHGQRVGLLSDPLKGEEWGPFYDILGDVYTALRKTAEPEGGFGTLLPAGIALIEAAAPKPELEAPDERDGPEDNTPLVTDAYKNDLP